MKDMYDVEKGIFLNWMTEVGHDQKLFKKGFRLDVRKFAFSNRVVNDWNFLSSQCVNCCTVNTLKISSN